MVAWAAFPSIHNTIFTAMNRRQKQCNKEVAPLFSFTIKREMDFALVSFVKDTRKWCTNLKVIYSIRWPVGGNKTELIISLEIAIYCLVYSVSSLCRLTTKEPNDKWEFKQMLYVQWNGSIFRWSTIRFIFYFIVHFLC